MIAMIPINPSFRARLLFSGFILLGTDFFTTNRTMYYLSLIEMIGKIPVEKAQRIVFLSL